MSFFAPRKSTAASGAGSSAAGTNAADDSMIDGTPVPAVTRAPRALPWVEKYRPRGMGDISSQDEIVRSLKKSIESGSIPHLLFYGPPGTGKTSTILAVARDLFGPELMRTRVMELNASDERGISVIREKVKTFAMGSVGMHGGASGIPFKLIVLDEADSLTADAQAALRRTMETYSKVTRFCIICNYVSRIIEPLASRCSKFRFKPLDRESMLLRLRGITTAEGVEADDEALNEVLNVSGGDMRKAITFLQSTAALYGGRVTKANIIEISGHLPTADAVKILDTVKNGSFDTVRRSAQGVILSGYGINTVLEKLMDVYVADPEISPLAKARTCEKIAQAEKKLADGADEELQLLDVLELAHRAAKNAMTDADIARAGIV